MKTNTLILTSLALLPAAMLTLTSCSSISTPPPPVASNESSYTEGVPGGVFVQSVKVTATVTAIDQAKRQMTLLESNGKEYTVRMGPEAVNFDQIRVGDHVIATVARKLEVSLDDRGAPLAAGTAALVARSPKGDQPAGLVAETTQMTAKVIAINLKQHTATLLFDDGIARTYQARPDVDLSRRNVGEQLAIRVTDMVAVGVEK